MAVVNCSVQEFIDEGCRCKLNCIHSFSKEDCGRIRDSFMDLTNEEKDLFLMGIFALFFKPGESSDVLEYQLEGKRICRQTFLFLTNISKYKLQNLRKHYNREGLSARRHGNTGRVPSNSHTFETRKIVKDFIENYAENHGVLLPKRIPGYRDQSIVLLSSAESKTSVFEFYKKSCNASEIVAVCSSLFFSLWDDSLCCHCQAGH